MINQRTDGGRRGRQGRRDPVAAATTRPVRTMGRRFGLALAAMAIMGLTVLLDRDGYNDGRDGSVSVLDAVYYSGVSRSTTGDGDIVPVSDTARLVNVAVITPLRVFFLALLVGTTGFAQSLLAQSPALGGQMASLTNAGAVAEVGTGRCLTADFSSGAIEESTC